MKTTIFLCFSLMLAFTVASQGLFTTLTDKYASLDGFSATNLTRDMFDLYLKKKQVESTSPVYETLKKLDNILVVSLSSLPLGKEPVKSPEKIPEMQKTMLNYYIGQSFTLFKTENRNGEDLKVFMKKNGDKVSALSLISATPTKITLVELNGNIDLASISEINKALNIKGLENLYKINGQPENFIMGQNLFDVYSHFSIDQQKYFQQLGEEMNMLNEGKMREWVIQNKELSKKQKEMVQKYREMAEKYGRHPVFLSAPGDTNVIYIIDGKKVNSKEINKINPDRIESISVIKPDKEHPEKKGEIKIKTK